MKTLIAPVKNIRLLYEAGRALQTRSQGVPGIGLVFGSTGYGKTTAAAWFANEVNAVHVRAFATWTPSSMLSAIMRELSGDPMGKSCAAMVEFIIKELTDRERPLFVDEADYLVGSKRLVETLRDLHDMSSSPLLLIGMADFRRKIMHREQLAGRIAEWVEFRPADLEDATTLASTVCEVEIAEDLLDRLRVSARGSMRGLIIGLDRIERWAKRQGKSKVTAKDWGDQPFTFASSASVEGN